MKNDKNVYRKDIIPIFARRTGMTQKKAEEVMDTFQEIICEFLCKKTSVCLTGFGTFRLRKVNERIARNPRTGEACPLYGFYKPEFKASIGLRKSVNEKIKENEASEAVKDASFPKNE